MADKPSIFLGSAADRPTEKDSLGFEPYVESVAKFLESPNTQPPLAISIEGEWGAGQVIIHEAAQESARWPFPHLQTRKGG